MKDYLLLFLVIQPFLINCKPEKPRLQKKAPQEAEVLTGQVFNDQGQTQGDETSPLEKPLNEVNTDIKVEEEPKNLDIEAQEQEQMDVSQENNEEAAEDQMAEPPVAANYLKLHNAFDKLPQGADSLTRVCANLNDDRVKDGLCNPNLTPITSLNALQTAFNLEFNAPVGGRGNNGNNGRAFAVNFHSTSLVGEFVNEINPRCIIFTPDNINNPMFMGFTRGDQFVELIAEDRVTGNLNFYLLTFKQACNAQEGGCTLGQLLTEAIEKDWLPNTVSIHTGADIDDTPFLCSHCHGTGENARALMPELNNPWDHWFRNNRTQQFIDRFEEAHAGDTQYCGIPIESIGDSDPANLEDVIELRQGNNGGQPFLFDSGNIANANDNEWQNIFQQFLDGEVQAVPNPEQSIMSNTQLQQATESYQAYLANPNLELLDYRTFRTPEAALATGHSFQDNTSGEELLLQACAICHNEAPSAEELANLNEPSRKRFYVLELNDAAINLAISRIVRPDDALELMPPKAKAKLSEAQKQTLINYLNSLKQQQ